MWTRIGNRIFNLDTKVCIYPVACSKPGSFAIRLSMADSPHWQKIGTADNEAEMVALMNKLWGRIGQPHCNKVKIG